MPSKAILLARLGVDAAALANEGFVVWKPDQSVLLEALQEAVEAADRSQGEMDLEVRIVSERSGTLKLIEDAQAVGSEPDEEGYAYIALY